MGEDGDLAETGSADDRLRYEKMDLVQESCRAGGLEVPSSLETLWTISFP